MIDKLTHYNNDLSSYIDLIFSSNVYLSKNCGVEQSLCETCHHTLINKSIKLSLKNRGKLTKRYHVNHTPNNKESLDIQAKECTLLTIESKERDIAKMSAKLDNLKTVPKIYWSIINKFLSNKKILSNKKPVLVKSELVSDFKQKANLFNNHFAGQCTPLKMEANYQTLVIKRKKY